MAKQEIKGVLEIFHRSRLVLDKEKNAFLEVLVSQTAIAIDSALLYENVDRADIEIASAYDKTIEGWVRALDLRDREMQGHTFRVVDLTMKLAVVMGLSEGELVDVRRGALLHDIGKLGIPDEVLHKQEQLTDAEWETMRMHPQYAYDMLVPISFLRSCLDIPYCHHEKWDGTGYPRGLKGDEIPFPARIFSVVDVYDALTSERPYRKALSKSRALGYIQDQAGKHFDPKVVKFFLELMENQDI